MELRFQALFPSRVAVLPPMVLYQHKCFSVKKAGSLAEAISTQVFFSSTSGSCVESRFQALFPCWRISERPSQVEMVRRVPRIVAKCMVRECMVHKSHAFQYFPVCIQCVIQCVIPLCNSHMPRLPCERRSWNGNTLKRRKVLFFRNLRFEVVFDWPAWHIWITRWDYTLDTHWIHTGKY